MAPITLKDVLYMQLKKPELAGMLADCCGEVGGGDSARMLTEAAFESNVAGAFARVKVNVTTDGVKKAVGRMCRIVKVVPGSEVYQIDGVSTAKLLEITFSGKVITVKMTQLNDTAITQADLDQWLATFSTNPTGGAPQTLPTKSGVLQKWIAIKNLRETRQKRALEKQGGAVEQAPAFSPPMETGGGGGGLTPPPLPVSAPGAVQSGVPASGFTPPMPHMGVQQQQQQHHQQHLPTIPALPTTPPPPPAPPQMQDAPLSAPPPPAPLPTVPSLPFIPSAFWTGQKEGYYFGTGTRYAKKKVFRENNKIKLQRYWLLRGPSCKADATEQCGTSCRRAGAATDSTYPTSVAYCQFERAFEEGCDKATVTSTVSAEFGSP